MFKPNASENEIIAHVSPLIESAANGQKISLFTYGPVAGGKTYTMIQILLASVDLLFQCIHKNQQIGGDSTLEVSFLEICNENVKDLLSNNKTTNENRDYFDDTDSARSYVQTKDELLQLINAVKERREVPNSHLMLQLYITTTFSAQNAVVSGALHFIDLASLNERDNNETSQLDSSLNELKSCVSALKRQQTNIVFHNSILTRLLQPALSGNFHSIMFANIPPFDFSAIKFALEFSAFNTADLK